MDAHAIRILEYEKIKALLAKHAVTAIGRERAMGLEPMRSLDFIRRAMAETTEMRRILDVLKAPPLDPLIDVRPLLEKVSPEGSLLEPGELLAIHSALAISRKTKTFFRELTVDAPLLKGMAASLHDFEGLESEIDKVVDDKAQVRDTASRELQRIRKQLRHERADLTRNVEKFMRSTEISRVLQERFFTVRENRLRR